MACVLDMTALPTRSMHLYSQAKEIIFNVNQYFQKEKENRGTIEDVTKVTCRTARATKVSERTVARICKEARNNHENNSPQFMSPKKRKRSEPIKDFFDNFNIGILRRTILNFYEREEIPTLEKIHEEMKNNHSYPGGRETLRKVLKEIGFRFASASTSASTYCESGTPEVILGKHGQGNEKSLSAEDTREQLEPHHTSPSYEDMDEYHCSELIEKDDQGYMKKEDVKNVMQHLQKAMQIIKIDSNQDQRVKLHNQVQNVFNIYHDLYYGSASSKCSTIFRMEGDVTDSISSINTTATTSGKEQDASKEWGVEDGKDSLLNDSSNSSGVWHHHPIEVFIPCEEAPSPEQQERQSASGEVSVTSPVSEYILVKRDVLLELASGSCCDTCRRGRPTSTITAQSGMAKKIVVKCFSCEETIEKYTSDKARDKQGFEINWKMTNFALKNKGYMTLEELAETVQIKEMGQSVFHEIVSQIEDVEIQEEKFSESKEWVQYKLQNGFQLY